MCLAVNRLISKDLRDLCRKKTKSLCSRNLFKPLLRNQIVIPESHCAIWRNNRKPSKSIKVDNQPFVILTFGHFKEDKVVKKCYRCRSSSHIVATCPKTRCWRCFKHGHMASQCKISNGQCMIKIPKSNRNFNTSAENRKLSLRRI